MIHITSLCDNVNNSKKLWSVEGNAILVEIDDRKFLFDVGRNAELLRHNLEVLQIDPASIDGVILTHGHMGHIGAFRGDIFFPKAVLYYGEGIDVPKVKWSPEGTKAVGNEALIARLQRHYPCVMVKDIYELVPGKAFLFKSKLMGSDLPAKDLLRMKIFVENCLERDLFAEELNLCIRHRKGLILLTGCAHRGVGNIVKTAQLLFPGEPIQSMIGGAHTLDDAQLVDNYIDQMNALGVSLVAPSHCTGIRGRARVAEALQDAYSPFGTGDELWFGED